MIGDGVLLHPPFPRVAPKHGRTVGRPWMILPVAAFNLHGPAGHAGPAGPEPARGSRWACRPWPADRDHVTIAVALELERVFGGWVPPR